MLKTCKKKDVLVKQKTVFCEPYVMNKRETKFNNWKDNELKRNYESETL